MVSTVLADGPAALSAINHKIFELTNNVSTTILSDSNARCSPVTDTVATAAQSIYNCTTYERGHGTVAVLLPGCVINWYQNHVTRGPQFRDLTHIQYMCIFP